MRRAQSISIDAIMAVFFLVIFLIATAYLTDLTMATADMPLLAEAQKILEASASGAASFLDGNDMVPSRLTQLLLLGYPSLRSLYATPYDFCIFFEDKDGQLIMINDGIAGIGDPSINVSGMACGTVANSSVCDVDGDTFQNGSACGGLDCDDTDAGINPAAAEVCDNGIDDDCDGSMDESCTACADADDDSYAIDGGSCGAVDCDDANASIFPGAAETCDARDDDCDGTVDDDAGCPCNTGHYGSSAYMFCDSSDSWSSAEDRCKTYSYHLLTISSAGENTWADSKADNISPSKWWMGFNDQAVEGSWVWVSGQAVNYTNWHAGEPSGNGNSKDCGEFNDWADRTWDDGPCTASAYYICEAPLIVAPPSNGSGVSSSGGEGGCQADCTREGQEVALCDASCDGVNGCDLQPACDGALKGMVIAFNATHDAVCCTDSFYLEKTNATVEAPSQDIVRMTGIVNFKDASKRVAGAKMNVIVYR